MVRDAAIMLLYVSVVEIAELAALPEQHFSDGHATGASGDQLLELLWGTALGLALAHWFAFRVVAPAFKGDHVSRHDTYVGIAQLGGATAVALISSVPVLLFSDVRAQETTGDVPSALIGIVAYLIARSAKRSRWSSMAYGLTAFVVGVLVAAVKSTLAAH